MAHGQAITRTATVEHDRDKNLTSAVGQPFHGRSRTLRLSDHARDLRQHGGFAQRFSMANHRAFVIERPGQHASASLAVERSRLTRQHGFVHRGAAFQDRCVHREALSRQYQHAVAGLDLFERDNGLYTIHNAAGGRGPQAGE
jgi:hypothetical protein